MIPQIIHYSWFSGDPFPSWIADCIDTWKDKLGDYEFMLWDMERIKDIDVPFVREAISVRKWAFAADYIRLYAINRYGGIWLDTDVEIFKSFNPLLNCDMFIGKESWADAGQHVYLTSHCFGAVAGHPFIRECLAYYTGRHFIRQDGTLDTATISSMQAEKALAYGFDWNARHKDRSQTLRNGIKVYPSYCFCRPLYTSMKKVYCIHRCAGAWRDKDTDGRELTNPRKMTLKVFLWNLLYQLHLK